MNRSHLVILSSNDTYVSCPLLSLGLSTARSNPLQRTSSHCKIDQLSWPNQINRSEKKYEAIIIMHKRNQQRLKYFHRQSDHKLTIHRIPTYTPQKKLHRIDLRGEHCI